MSQQSLVNLSTKIGKKWKMLARYLSLDDSIIDEIESNDPTNMGEMVYQTLVTWKQKAGVEASEEQLCQALVNCGFRSVVDEMKPNYFTA